MDELYDVTVIGGGVVGCAVLHTLTSYGYRCILLEKNQHLVSEASSGNSGMLHTGFDAIETTELACIQYTQRHVFNFMEKVGLPCKKTGATMVAWNAEQKSRLPTVLEKCRLSKVATASEISVSTLYQMEPNIGNGAHGALWIPDEAVVDPWLTPLSFVHQAKRKRGTVLTNTLFQDCHYNMSRWDLTTDRGNVISRAIINCAGLYGDIIDTIGGYQNFQIKPRSGQYIVYSKSGKHLINSSILPVPTDRGKGVIVFKSVYDNVIVGPTAEETQNRQKPLIDDHITMRLKRTARDVVPNLHSNAIVRMYTGVRPATENKDYQIHCHPSRNWLTVGGIRSTGLSGCLGIANVVKDLVMDKLKVEPTFSENHSLSRQSIVMETDGTATIDRDNYVITHPITLSQQLEMKARL